MMTPRILVQNRQRMIRVDVPPLQDFAERALRECLTIRATSPGLLATLSEVGIILISDRRMAQLHRQYLRLAGPTDVITFQHGEVFISAETARRQARAFRSSTEREIQLYLIHGLLHLHGLDDQTEKAAKAMGKVQDRIVARLSQRPARSSPVI